MLSVSLGEAQANSYKNFHARGVDYVCLHRTPELTIKVYMFDGDVSKFPEVVNPHDHRYRFKTTTLNGALRNINYVYDAHGERFNQFNWRTPLNGGNGFEWWREAILRPVYQQTLFKGESYELHHDVIHTIKVLENETMLMLEQYEDDLPMDAATSTFVSVDKGREPPSLDGLYERFGNADLLARLRLIGRVMDTELRVAP